MCDPWSFDDAQAFQACRDSQRAADEALHARIDGRIGELVGLLDELRDWFKNEVQAGDTALQLWVDKIDEALYLKAPTPTDCSQLPAVPYHLRRNCALQLEG